MDGELLAWLEEVKSLDETDDALLNALVGGSPRPVGAVGSFDAHEQRLLRIDQLSSAHLSDPNPHSALEGVSTGAASAGGRCAESTQQPPVKKRKKRGTWRAKDEIERLRQSVVDLETLIALHTPRRSVGSTRVLTIAHENASSELDSGVWRGVAARQMSRLRESLRENTTLRAQAQHQLRIAKSLARLVQRARGSMSPPAIPRNPVPLDDATMAAKRQKLIATVSAIFQSVGAMPSCALSRSSNEEFRTARTFAKLSDSSVCPGHYWRISDIDGSRLTLHHVERFPQLHVLVQSLELSTAHGPALFRTMGVRARFRCESARDVIVTAGSFWPDASAPANFASVGFDQHVWTVTEPHAGATGLANVAVHSECTCIDAPVDANSDGGALALRPPSPPPSRPRAVLLDDIVTASQAHMLSEIDRLLDQILLDSA